MFRGGYCLIISSYFCNCFLFVLESFIFTVFTRAILSISPLMAVWRTYIYYKNIFVSFSFAKILLLKYLNTHVHQSRWKLRCNNCHHTMHILLLSAKTKRKHNFWSSFLYRLKPQPYNPTWKDNKSMLFSTESRSSPFSDTSIFFLWNNILMKYDYNLDSNLNWPLLSMCGGQYELVNIQLSVPFAWMHYRQLSNLL